MTDEISPRRLMIFGVVSGLAGIYLTLLNGVLDVKFFSFFGALGAIGSVVWGAEAVKQVTKYGLGTGVPSIGQLALGMGIVAAMFGLSVAEQYRVPLAGPIIAFVTAVVIGRIIGILAQHVIKMKIPVMIRCMTEIAGAGSLVIVGLSLSITGSFVFSDVVRAVFDFGFILAVFWVGAVAILHPFNACLGPDEKQRRTIFLAFSTGSIAMFVAGLGALLNLGRSGLPTIVLGALLWLLFYKKFWSEVYQDADSVVGTGLIPETEV